MVTRETLTDAANRVRRNLVALTDGDLCGNCFLVPFALRAILGEDVQRVVGRYDGNAHEWAAIEIEGEVWFVDVTADQFGGPSVVITTELPEEFSDFTGEDFDTRLEREFQDDIVAAAA